MRPLNLIAGMFLSLYGLGVYINGDTPSYSPIYQTSIDISNIHKPYGILSLILGIYITLMASSKKTKKRHKYLICPNCEEPFFYTRINTTECPKCNVELKNMDGYFSRVKKDSESTEEYIPLGIVVFLASILLVGPMLISLFL